MSHIVNFIILINFPFIKYYTNYFLDLSIKIYVVYQILDIQPEITQKYKLLNYLIVRCSVKFYIIFRKKQL